MSVLVSYIDPLCILKFQPIIVHIMNLSIATYENTLENCIITVQIDLLLCTTPAFSLLYFDLIWSLL